MPPTKLVDRSVPLYQREPVLWNATNEVGGSFSSFLGVNTGTFQYYSALPKPLLNGNDSARERRASFQAPQPGTISHEWYTCLN
jgi:hypothetical protein